MPKLGRKLRRPKQSMMFGIKPEAPTPTQNEVTLLDFETHGLRMVMRDGQPWWMVADVARILGHRDATNAARYLRGRDLHTLKGSTNAGTREFLIVNEPGLYRLIMRSNKPEAERFQDWITDEVLPSIRKTGTYTAPSSRVGKTQRRLGCNRETAIARVESVDANKSIRAQLIGKGATVTAITQVHNAPHIGMFGGPAKQLRQALGITTTPLDRMEPLPLAINSHVKTVVAQQLKEGVITIEGMPAAIEATSRELVQRDMNSLGAGYCLGILDDPSRGKILGVVRQLSPPAAA
jgi:prophage antirepressor-like protein